MDLLPVHVPFELNTTWVEETIQATDPSKFMHPPASATGIDMTWVVDIRCKYACFLCVLFACLVSMVEIREHAARFDYPKIQIYVIRILFMIPFYGVLSFLSVCIHELRFFLDTIRDTYEAFVLYTFFSLLVEYCGGEAQLLRALHAKKYMGVHPWPLCCIPMYPLNTEFFLRCKRYVLQYALIKPIASLLTCVGAPFGWYEEAHFAHDNLYPYIFTINNISISYSLYYLVLFHIETEKELAYCKPTWKFVCIKSIIFFAFWQSATVAVMIALGWMYTGDTEELREEVNTGIQDVLMCFELLPVAFMHHLAFGRVKLGDEMAAEPIYDNDGAKSMGNTSKHIDAAMSLGDVFQDIIGTIFYRKSRLFDDNDGTAVDDDEEGFAAAAVAGEMGGGGGGVGGTGGASATGGNGSGGGVAAGGRRPGQTFEPTVEELVAYAVANDRGVRVDGLLHYDPDEERDLRNQTVDDDRAEEDETIHRLSGNNGIENTAVVVVTGGVVTGPSAYCVVCGRYDRQLVKRDSGYKCVECQGRRGNKELVARQKEVHAEDNDGSCVVCGKSGKPMVRRGTSMKCVDCISVK